MLALLSLTLASAPRISLPDLSGKQIQVFPTSAKRGVVAFFVISGCPNANAYVPEMNRIAKQYEPKGWRFYLVYTDLGTSVADLTKSARQFEYVFPVLRGQGKLMELATATKSPDAAVFSASGSLLYNGRIDDRFYALGKSRNEPRVRDLRLALDAATAGKPVPNPRSEVIGCYIPNG